MSNEKTKVLCVPKAAVTSALGGKLFHGVHAIQDKQAFIAAIEPNLEVVEHEEALKRDDVVFLMPWLFFPRAEVTETPPNASTSLFTYSISLPLEGGGKTTSQGVSFSNYVIEEQVNVYAETPAPEGVETIADERVGKIALFQSLNNSVQTIVRDRILIKEREFTGEPDVEQLVVQDTGYVIVDHTTQLTQKFISIIFMCMLPKQYTPGRKDADGEMILDLGEVTLVDLMDKSKTSRLQPVDLMVVENLYQAEISFNEALRQSAVTAGEAIEKAQDSSSN